MENLSDEMKNEAIKCGLCEQWNSEWKDNSTKEEMVDKFVRGLDFCIKNNYPSLEKIEEFKKEANERDVYINQYVSLDNPGIVVLNGKCNAIINLDLGCSTIWVRHDSILTLSIKNGATAFVKCLDNSNVNINCGFFSKCFVYKYSEGTSITHKGDIKIREKIDFYKIK